MVVAAARQFHDVQRLHLTQLASQILLVLQVVRLLQDGRVADAAPAVQTRPIRPESVLLDEPHEQEDDGGQDKQTGRNGANDGHHVIAAARKRRRQLFTQKSRLHFDFDERGPRGAFLVMSRQQVAQDARRSTRSTRFRRFRHGLQGHK